MYAHKIAAIQDTAEREVFVSAMRKEYEENVDLLQLASDLVVDTVIEPEQLREEIIGRIRMASGKSRHFSDRCMESHRFEDLVASNFPVGSICALV